MNGGLRDVSAESLNTLSDDIDESTRSFINIDEPGNCV